MFKNIYVSEAEALKLPVEIMGGKDGSIVKEHVSNEEFEKTFVIFSDTNNNKYLLTHGQQDGTIQFLMKNGTTEKTYLAFIYEMLVDKEIIEPTETLNVICCHGRNVKEAQTKLDNIGFTHRYEMNVSIINDTRMPCTMYVNKMKNGNFKVSVFSLNTKLGKLSMIIDAAIAYFRHCF